jgi:hypothetical protein
MRIAKRSAVIAVLALAAAVVLAVRRARTLSPPGVGAVPEAESKPPIFYAVRGTLPRWINESSGVAVSRRQEGVLWTHNDSGSRPFVFGVSILGEDLARLLVEDVELTDWEDMALGPCPPGLLTDAQQDCLYIADTGNNLRNRDTLSIYVLPEPSIDPNRLQGTSAGVSGAQRYDFTFPDDIYDVEALALAPDGSIYLVTKDRSDFAKVFQIGIDGSVQTATYIQDLTISPMRNFGRLVTGAAFSPDGTTLAVRTYTEVFFYRLEEDGSFHLKGPPCLYGFIQVAGEAVDWLDDGSLVLTSEALSGNPGTIIEMRCQTD